jgi:hypothetical protein
LVIRSTRHSFFCTEKKTHFENSLQNNP